MLSRLSSRAANVAARSLLRNPRCLTAAPSVVDRQSFRSFNSSPALKNAEVATPKVEAQDPVSIVDKYGSTTFWGMVAAILVSKEVFILDAEFLLSVEIGAFFMTAYVLAGDTITKLSEEMDKKAVDKFNGANDFALEMFNQYKIAQSAVQNKPEVMAQYHKEFKAAIEAHAQYETVKPQHAARAQVVAALEQIKQKEEHALAMEWQNTVDRAVGNVTAAFQKKDAKLSDEMLDLAIKNLGFTTPVTTDANDPVKRLFMKEF